MFKIVVVLCFSNPNLAISEKLPCEQFSKVVEATDVMQCARRVPDAQRELLEVYGLNTFILMSECEPVGEPV